MSDLVRLLRGTDRRSIGESNRVVAAVLKNPRAFDAVFNAMLSDDPVLRMRAADAVEKITATRPDLLRPHKRTLLTRVALIEQQEVRWHVAQLISRLILTPRERRAAIEILDTYFGDKSSIVKTFAMQALADLVTQDEKLRAPVIARLTELVRTGTPAMKSRGRKLLAILRSERSL
ncbi:MAG: hypothetical protein HY868_09830 [Chloroflexi bacterium]|nr:hypothetical protein [Chloroflexota bacterium]